MSPIKSNRVRALSTTARYPRTFAARLANIPADLQTRLTAREIAMVIDTAQAASYAAGVAAGLAADYDDDRAVA